MWKVIGKRALIVVPMLWAIVTLTFLLVQLLPGDPGRTILGQEATVEQVRTLDHQLGVDRPLLSQYGSYLEGLVHGDFGTSILNGTPVSGIIGPRLPVTLSLAICATVVLVLIGMSLGTLAAVAGGRTDGVIRFLASIMMSLPSFWLGVILVAIFSVSLGWLPATGYTPLADSPGEWVRYLILPVLAISAAGTAAVIRQTRAAVTDVMERDYIRTLRANGASARSLVLRHALRNAAIPILATIGFQFIGILGGTVVIETVFTLPGIGQQILQAVGAHDLPVIIGIVVWTTLIVLLTNLVVDIVSIVLNPRLRTP